MIGDYEAKYLWDAREAAEQIRQFAAGRSLEDYLGDDLLRSAVERKFILIGEACSQLRKLNPDVAAAVPDLAEIIAFRHVLVHGYSDVDHHRVWQVIGRDLPLLIGAIGRLLDQAEPL